MWKTPLQELNITETEVLSEGIKDRLEDFDLQTYMQFIPELTEEQKKEIEKEQKAAAKKGQAANKEADPTKGSELLAIGDIEDDEF